MDDMAGWESGRRPRQYGQISQGIQKDQRANKSRSFFPDPKEYDAGTYPNTDIGPGPVVREPGAHSDTGYHR